MGDTRDTPGTVGAPGTLAELADYLERECHSKTRAAVGALRTCGGAWAELEAALERRMRELSDVLLPRIRALEVARLGAGPWPDPSFGSLRTRLSALESKSRDIAELVERVRSASLPREAPALAATLHQLEVERVLLRRAADLEPERRGLNRTETRSGAPGDSLRRASAPIDAFAPNANRAR